MKKTNNIFLMLLLAIIGIGLYSCSDDMVKSDFDYKPDSSVGLATIQLNILEKASDEEITLGATITGTGNSPIYDQGFLYSTDQNFATYETLSITPGETTPNQLETTIGIAQGKELYFRAFVLTKDGLVTSSETKSIRLPVTWEKVGMVNLTENTFSGDTYQVEIQKFSGRNEYRLIDPFDTGDTGNVLRFLLDENANADNDGVPAGEQPGSSGYSFYWDTRYVGSYCTFSNKANVYTLTFFLLQGSTLYTGGEIIFEWVDGYPGEIPEPVEPIEVSYKTDFSDEAGKAGWILDKYSGVKEDDLVFYFDMADAGAASLGTAIAAYHESEPLKIISPSITVAENDTLSFSLYSGLFGSGVNAKVKVYIREVGGELDLDTPVKNWDLPGGGGSTAIPLEEYADKSIKVIFVVEQGDFLFYRFAVAPTSDQDLIFQ